MAALRRLHGDVTKPFQSCNKHQKESISAQNVGPQARQAVLHVVTTDTGIFTTTLSLDVLHPHSLEHRKSVMQLVAFLIRKVGLFFSFHPLNQIFLTPSLSLQKPLVVRPNLPKLMEAVVKSLDPNSTSHRDAVQDAATEILGHVVKTCAPDFLPLMFNF